MKKTTDNSRFEKTIIDIELDDKIIECRPWKLWTEKKIICFINKIRKLKIYGEKVGKEVIVYFWEEPPERVVSYLKKMSVKYYVWESDKR